MCDVLRKQIYPGDWRLSLPTQPGVILCGGYIGFVAIFKIIILFILVGICDTGHAVVRRRQVRVIFAAKFHKTCQRMIREGVDQYARAGEDWAGMSDLSGFQTPREGKELKVIQRDCAGIEGLDNTTVK